MNLTVIHVDREKVPNAQSQTESTESDVNISAFSFESDVLPSSFSQSENVDCNEFDLGKWIGKSALMTTAQKHEMLKRCWKPAQNYDFHQDAIDPKRPFLHNWLQIYEPWLVYTKKSKGALCLYCVLFPPTTVRGILGTFTATPFTRFQKFHESAKSHSSSQFHKNSTMAAKLFVDSLPVDVQMVTGHQKLVEKNRKILLSIISTVMFCGAHDMALRGDNLREGNKIYLDQFLLLISFYPIL